MPRSAPRPGAPLACPSALPACSSGTRPQSLSCPAPRDAGIATPLPGLRLEHLEARRGRVSSRRLRGARAGGGRPRVPAGAAFRVPRALTFPGPSSPPAPRLFAVLLSFSHCPSSSFSFNVTRLILSRLPIHLILIPFLLTSAKLLPQRGVCVAFFFFLQIKLNIPGVGVERLLALAVCPTILDHCPSVSAGGRLFWEGRGVYTRLI